MKLFFTFAYLVSSLTIVAAQNTCEADTNLLDVANPPLGVARTSYNGFVVGSVQANCLDDAGALQACSGSIGTPEEEGTTLSSVYYEVCLAAGGIGWTYDARYLCDTDIEQGTDNVFFCSDGDCDSTGASNIVSSLNDMLSTPLTAAGFTCGSSSANLEKLEYDDSSAVAWNMASVAGGLVLATFMMS
jgi:hypothetical protein